MTPGDARARKLRFGPPRIKALYAGQKKPAVWLIIGFLCIWLVGWTLGIVFAIVTLLFEGISLEEGDLFLAVWLAFALLGWALRFGFFFGSSGA